MRDPGLHPKSTDAQKSEMWALPPRFDLLPYIGIIGLLASVFRAIVNRLSFGLNSFVRR